MGFIDLLMASPIVEIVKYTSLDVVVGNLMKLMNSWVGNLGVTVILFTVLLKLVVFPLDFFSRRSMKIYQLKMETIQPQMDKIKKQYANNKQLMQQKMMSVQKKMGANAFASCLPSIVTMVLFIYVFSAFSSYVTYNNIQTYNDLANTYNEQIAENNIVNDDIPKEVQDKIDAALIKKYNSLNRNFLWVKNVSIADVPWLNPIAANASSFIGAIKGDRYNISNADYQRVMGPIIDHYKNDEGKMKPNGFLILPILAVGLSVLSQLITMKMQKNTNPMGEMNGQKTMMKVMMFIFPIMFLTFALSSSTAFTIYMTMNSLLSLLTTLFINFIVEKTVKLKEKKIQPTGVGRRKI